MSDHYHCGMLKFIKGRRAKNLLKYCLSKDELENLKYYVTTHARSTPPTDNSDPSKKDTRSDLIRFFIKDVFQKDRYGKFFIVLGESGIGKFIFLQKLFLKYKRKIFQRHNIYFYPLSNEVDISEWEQIQDKHDSILLLDALDEDSYAIKNYKERIDQITKASYGFYKVVITCRTHFFPDEESEPNDIQLIRYGTKTKKLGFFKIYISDFNDHDIDKYFRKRYRSHMLKRARAKKIIKKCTDIMARPLLLSYIDDLLRDRDTYSCVSDIYEKLIHEWLCREPCGEGVLRQFSNRVMHYVYEHNTPYVTTGDISSLCREEIEVIDPILARTRSLLTRNSRGEYKFAHRSIYEYMISYEAVYNDVTIRRLLWDPQTNIDFSFYREMSVRYAKENNDDFRFLYFADADLSDIIFSRKNLADAYLERACLNGMYFKEAHLERTYLKGAYLEKANLKGAYLYGACLDGAHLEGAYLNGAHLELSHLEGTHLYHTHLFEAHLRGAYLNGAHLYGAYLNRVHLEKTNLEKADLSYCTLWDPVLDDTFFMGSRSKVQISMKRP